MIKLYIDIPAGFTWDEGYQTIELPSVPRVGESLIDLNNNKLEVKDVLYRTDPREIDDQPHIELVVK